MQKEKRRGNRRGGQSTGREIEIGRPSRRRERALEPHLGLALHRGRPGEDIVDHDVRHREAFARRASRGLGGVGGAAPKKRRPGKNLRLSKKIFSSTINSIVRSAEIRLVRAESDEAFERPHTSSSAPRRPVGVPHSLSLPPPAIPLAFPPLVMFAVSTAPAAARVAAHKSPFAGTRVAIATRPRARRVHSAARASATETWTSMSGYMKQKCVEAAELAAKDPEAGLKAWIEIDRQVPGAKLAFQENTVNNVVASDNMQALDKFCEANEDDDECKIFDE